MKKTFNINLSGRPFIIDDDAYDLLKEYLDTLAHAFGNDPDMYEINQDIESRIAEIFAEMNPDSTLIISRIDVENVICRIGRPEQLVSADNYGDTASSETCGADNDANTPPPNVGNTSRQEEKTGPAERVKARLYRDPQDCMIGGVCSGVGHYLGIDPTWIRLIFVFAVFCSFSTIIPVYIILWIIIPEAKTPYQRMRMKGENPTIYNIGKSVTDMFHRQNTGPDNSRRDMPLSAHIDKSSGKAFADKVAAAFGWIAKALLYICVIIAIPVVIALGIAFVACVFALFVSTSDLGMEAIMTMGSMLPWPLERLTVNPYSSLIGCSGLILAIGIPLLWFCTLPFSRRQSGWSPVKIVLASIWAAGLITAVVCICYMSVCP